MDRIEVESTSLSSIAYSNEGVLEVEFRSAEIYRFFMVPALVWEELKRAESKGEHFNTAIKDRFPFIRVPREQDDTLLSDLERSLQALKTRPK